MDKTRIPIGTKVRAWNPGGNAVTGRLVDYTPEGFAHVEWFGPWFYDQERRYVGTFTRVEGV